MKSIKTNYIYSLLYQFLSIALPLLTTPYLTRMLGSAGLGTYSLNFTIVQYFALFILLGLNNYGNRVVAACRNDKVELSKNFINIYSFQVICGVVVSIAYIFYSCFWAADTMIALVFYIYLFSSIIDINWFFFGLEKFQLTVVRNSVIKIASMIAVFVFVNSPEDVITYCIIIACTHLVSQAVLWLYLRKEIQFEKPNKAEIIKHIKPNCTLFITVIFVSLFKLMDKVMLGSLSSRSELGFYEASEKIVSVPTSIVVALGSVMLPRTTNLLATGHKEIAEKYINISCLFSMFISSSICFGIMGVCKEFVPLYYGEGFEECINLFIILLPSCIFLAFGNVIRTQYLLPNSMDKPYIVSAVIGAIMNLVANFLLIPRYGAEGAAVGTLLAEISVCVYQATSVLHKIDIKKYVIQSIPFVLSGIFMFIVLHTIEFVGISVQLCILLKIIIGAITYFSSLIVIYFLVRIIVHKKWIDIVELVRLLRH